MTYNLRLTLEAAALVVAILVVYLLGTLRRSGLKVSAAVAVAAIVLLLSGAATSWP